MSSNHACQIKDELTNDVLDDNLHGPERHVTTRYAVGSAGSPLIWRHSLKEMLNCRKQLYWVKFQICQVLRNIPGQFPYALKNEFSHLGFLGVRYRAIRREGSDNLKEESEQATRQQSDHFQIGRYNRI
jgi:hypothetical protein